MDNLSNGQPDYRTSDDIRVDMAEQDLFAAEQENLGEATNAQLVLLVERLRSALAGTIPIARLCLEERRRRMAYAE